MENHRYRENISDKGLREFFRQLNNTPNKRYTPADYTRLRSQYLKMVDKHKDFKRLKRNENRRNQRRADSFFAALRNAGEEMFEVENEKEKSKLIKRFLKKKLTNKRYKISPEVSHFTSYNVYTIPSYDNWIINKMNKMTKDKGYIEVSFSDVRKYAKQISNYSYLSVQKSISQFGYVRCYVDLQLKCFNTQLEEIFISNFNMGRRDFNNFQEFNSYLLDGFYRAFENMNGKDYIIVYGFGETKINVLRYNPMEWSGSSYVAIPKFISDTKGVINIKNTDNECFMWCLIASRHEGKHHAERVSHYNKPDYITEWIFKKTDLPMPVNKIQYFEKANNVKINVYTLDSDDKTRIPLYISKHKSEELINLFYYNKHYCLIKNFSRFCGNDDQHVCPNCLAKYANRVCYSNHLDVCKELNESGSFVKMPKDFVGKNKKTGKEFTIKSTTAFNSYSKQKRLPVVMYADFESNLEACDNHKKKNVVAKHTPNSFRLRIESDVDLGIPLDYAYTGSDVDLKFIELLVNDLEEVIQTKLRECCSKNSKPILTSEEEKSFQLCKDCRFCSKPLKINTKPKYSKNWNKTEDKWDFTVVGYGKTELDKVRDHCHFTGKYEGAAHSKCNIKAHQMFKEKISIPVIFHNANYDIRCFISAFQKIKGDACVSKISGIPCNMELFKSININNFNIICSYAHLSSSLDTLIKNLPDSKKNLLKTIATDENFELIKKKGFYPYELITSIDRLDFPITDLKREHFNSKLTLSKIDEKDWLHIQEVISNFGITNFRQYHDLYLKIDVYGLHDVFEYHRELTMATYGLDPAHFIGLPQLTWTAGLKFTGVKLDDITDVDMFMMFEKMKRGGVSVISHKHAKANNPYLPNYDKNKDTSYLMQLDCNNLYGWAMNQKLPISNFTWYTGINKKFIMNYVINSNKGYIVECDLEYPTELHDRDNDYPLAPEHLEINKMIKLAPNFNDKNKYVVHIENLKYYLSKGLILKNIYRCIEFNHSNWLKLYIDNNSSLRQKATNDFEKDFYKLMNNAFYGKTMENVRDRVNIQFCLDKEKFIKHTSSPLFANQINIIKENGLALVKTHKKTVELNKPIYIGACVLDFSKLLMYKFHYDVMKVKYPEALMMKTDTDSLLYYVKTDDIYKDFKNDVSIQKEMEFSNYPKNHFLYNCDRKKQVGLFQDECVDGKLLVISEYIGLRAKSYANKLYCVEEEMFEEKKKSKGVSSKHVKKRIDFEDYKQCLLEDKVISLGKATDTGKFAEKIYSFISYNLTTFSVEQSKIALNSKDDKRVPMKENKFNTYAIGHYKIQK